MHDGLNLILPENIRADHSMLMSYRTVRKIWWTRLHGWNKERAPWYQSKNRAGSLTLAKGKGARETRERAMSWFVYILRCSDNSLYCGTTTDLARRVEAHNAGTGARYTRSKLPVRLVWFAQTRSKSDAFREEFRIKRLPKNKKELLAAGQEIST